MLWQIKFSLSHTAKTSARMRGKFLHELRKLPIECSRFGLLKFIKLSIITYCSLLWHVLVDWQERSSYRTSLCYSVVEFRPSSSR